MKFNDLQQQYMSVEENINSRIKSVLKHGHFIMGPEVAELEEQLASYCGVEYAVAVANGTDALQLSLMALGIGRGDYVLTTSFSFFATAEAIVAAGAEPIFVDIDPQTYNICPVKLESKISECLAKGVNIKAVLAVDLFGLPADYSLIEETCTRNGLKLIEDAAQSFGGSIDKKKACSFGDIATTSFFPAKPLGCYGDGGAVLTNSSELAEIVSSLRVHGKGRDKYDNVRIGMNSRLDTIQAAVLLEKLTLLDDERDRKQKVLERYNANLQAHYTTPIVPEGYESAIAQYSIRVRKGARDELQAFLKQRSIPSAIYYQTPMPLLKAFENLETDSDSCKASAPISRDIISLPMHAYMTITEQESVIASLLEFSSKKGL